MSLFCVAPKRELEPQSFGNSFSLKKIATSIVTGCRRKSGLCDPDCTVLTINAQLLASFSQMPTIQNGTQCLMSVIFLRQLISNFAFKCGSCGLRPGWESRPPRSGQVLRTFLFRFFLFLVLRFGNHSWLCVRLSLFVNSLDGLFRRFCIRPVFWICLICVFWVWHAGFLL
jgi:hypothetical protein